MMLAVLVLSVSCLVFVVWSVLRSGLCFLLAVGCCWLSCLVFGMCSLLCVVLLCVVHCVIVS